MCNRRTLQCNRYVRSHFGSSRFWSQYIHMIIWSYDHTIIWKRIRRNIFGIRAPIWGRTITWMLPAARISNSKALWHWPKCAVLGSNTCPTIEGTVLLATKVNSEGFWRVPRLSPGSWPVETCWQLVSTLQPDCRDPLQPVLLSWTGLDWTGLGWTVIYWLNWHELQTQIRNLEAEVNNRKSTTKKTIEYHQHSLHRHQTTPNRKQKFTTRTTQLSQINNSFYPNLIFENPKSKSKTTQPKFKNKQPKHKNQTSYTANQLWKQKTHIVHHNSTTKQSNIGNRTITTHTPTVTHQTSNHTERNHEQQQIEHHDS